MASQEVREIEGARLRQREPAERGGTGEELVAVRARQPLHPELGEHAVEPATGPTVGVGDEDRVVAIVSR